MREMAINITNIDIPTTITLYNKVPCLKGLYRGYNYIMNDYLIISKYTKPLKRLYRIGQNSAITCQIVCRYLPPVVINALMLIR